MTCALHVITSAATATGHILTGTRRSLWCQSGVDIQEFCSLPANRIIIIIIIIAFICCRILQEAASLRSGFLQSTAFAPDLQSYVSLPDRSTSTTRFTLLVMRQCVRQKYQHYNIYTVSHTSVYQTEIPTLQCPSQIPNIITGLSLTPATFQLLAMFPSAVLLMLLTTTTCRASSLNPSKNRQISHQS